MRTERSDTWLAVDLAEVRRSGHMSAPCIRGSGTHEQCLKVLEPLTAKRIAAGYTFPLREATAP